MLQSTLDGFFQIKPQTRKAERKPHSKDLFQPSDQKTVPKIDVSNSPMYFSR